MLRKSGVAHEDQAEALYSRLTDPTESTPYPDTEVALEDTATTGVKVGVLNNIAFDMRPAFSMRGHHDFVDEFLLPSGRVIKPRPDAFRLLIDKLGVAPEDTLMVGDSEEADGGAKALRSEFALVAPRPTTERPDGLLTYGVL